MAELDELLKHLARHSSNHHVPFAETTAYAQVLATCEQTKILKDIRRFLELIWE